MLNNPLTKTDVLHDNASDSTNISGLDINHLSFASSNQTNNNNVNNDSATQLQIENLTQQLFGVSSLNHNSNNDASGAGLTLVNNPATLNSAVNAAVANLSNSLNITPQNLSALLDSFRQSGSNNSNNTASNTSTVDPPSFNPNSSSIFDQAAAASQNNVNPIQNQNQNNNQQQIQYNNHLNNLVQSLLQGNPQQQAPLNPTLSSLVNPNSWTTTATTKNTQNNTAGNNNSGSNNPNFSSTNFASNLLAARNGPSSTVGEDRKVHRFFCFCIFEFLSF